MPGGILEIYYEEFQLDVRKNSKRFTQELQRHCRKNLQRFCESCPEVFLEESQIFFSEESLRGILKISSRILGRASEEKS